jgi:DNA-binding HxlR family transcriptional regulator
MAIVDGPVRGSRSGRPVMALLDLLGRRWTLRVIWELREGPLVFRELQARCGISPSVLNTRLAELREALIVEAGESGYGLSARGAELLALLAPVNGWAAEWAAALRRSAR